jgi:hypothetical protein
VKKGNPISDRRGSFDRRHAALGTICLVLYVEMSMALGALLRTITGKNWFVPSLVVTFFLVSLLYGKLEEWFGLEPVPPQPDPPDTG